LNRSIANTALLILGYGAGQGSLFLAQTWLIAHGEVAIFSSFGIAFYTASLLLMLIDFGVSQYVTREVANTDDIHEISITHSASLALRSTIASLAILAISIYFLLSRNFLSTYLIWASPAFAVWVFNATGILDGNRMSGLSGSSAAVPFVLSSLALAFSSKLPQESQAMVLGATLSVGYTGTIVAQYTSLAIARKMPSFYIPDIRLSFRIAPHCFSALFSTLPGQLYFRFQMAICAAFFTPAVTASFLYAKQIIAAFAQIINFLRRAEFPDTVKRISSASRTSINREIFLGQKMSIAVSVTALVLTLILSITLSILPSLSTKAAPLAVAVFAPTIVTSTFALAAVQGLMAMQQFHMAAVTSLVATAVATLLSAALAYKLGLYGLAIADLLGNVATVAMTLRITSRRTV